MTIKPAFQFVDYFLQFSMGGFLVVGERPKTWEPWEARGFSSYMWSNLWTRGDRISGSRPTSPSWIFWRDCNAPPAPHWNAFKLPARPQVYPERTLSPEVKIGKKRERRHCTLATLGMHSNHPTTDPTNCAAMSLKAMVVVLRYSRE